MGGINGSTPEFAELDHSSANAYRHAIKRGQFVREEIADELQASSTEVSRIEGVLRHLRLLQPLPGDPDRLAPVSPDAAAAELLGSSEGQIRELQQAVSEVRTRMLSLMPTYFEGRRRRNQMEAFDLITDVDTIRALLDEHLLRARAEMLTVQPGGARPPEVLDTVRNSNVAALDRGVRMRTLYQHTARSDLVTSAYVSEVTAKGAEIRTTDELIDRLIIYDREVAFLPEQNLPDPGRGAVIIREPNLVAFMCSVFDHMWQGALPFQPGTSAPEPLADEVKASILRLMANGYKDEMVARRLGMSVRTCRRHIAEITEELKATSRFQAGVNATLSGLVQPSSQE
ncbi:LuxR C-terminal-related transcriptional regulator [Streptomyces sp. NPDC017991]|uniref:LuxR C-terminal-related transcriptional regulator n=1 Tax=Streptomyces sp. NPDC017991 TaxID=3365026 RepID=UPI0037A5B633